MLCDCLSVNWPESPGSRYAKNIFFLFYFVISNLFELARMRFPANMVRLIHGYEMGRNHFGLDARSIQLNPDKQALYFNLQKKIFLIWKLVIRVLTYRQGHHQQHHHPVGQYCPSETYHFSATLTSTRITMNMERTKKEHKLYKIEQATKHKKIFSVKLFSCNRYASLIFLAPYPKMINITISYIFILSFILYCCCCCCMDCPRWDKSFNLVEKLSCPEYIEGGWEMIEADTNDRTI